MNEHESTSKVRTRIAPSPTGYPHIGTIYQALFDYAFAKKMSGEFIVRIEDTDRTRFVSDAEEKLFAALDWFHLQEDESPRKGGPYNPYRQSERLEHYKKHAEELLEKGHAYYCFCTKERLDEVRKKQQEEKQLVMYDKHCRTIPLEEAKKRVANGEVHVIRMKVPENETITYKDEIRGDISVASNSVDDQVIIKSDGFPTYHLAVVVDDHDMQISHVLRGPEWLSSTPKHFLLYDFLGWKKPFFFHTPMLSNPDHSKLSKRHGHTNVSWYQEEGYLPEAILNFLALLGWSHPEQKELFSLDEFTQYVELKDLKPVAPIFDITKLTWMNQQYILKMDTAELKDTLMEYYKNDEIILNLLQRNAFVNDILDLVKTRITTLKEFRPLVIPFIEAPDPALLSEEHKNIAPRVREALEKIPDDEWNQDKIFETLKSVLEERSVKMPVFYMLFTGNKHGLPLPQMLEILTKKNTLERLERFVQQ